MRFFIVFLLTFMGCATRQVNLASPPSPQGMEAFMEAVYASITGEDEAAEIQFKKALQNNPESPTIASSYAEFLLQRGRIEEAEKIVQPLLKKWGENPDLLHLMVQIAQAKQNLGNAIEYLFRLHKVDPQNPAVGIKLGAFLFYATRLQEAKKVLRNYDHPQAIWMLSLICKQLGELWKAEQYLKQYLRRDPTSLRAMQKLVEVYAEEEKYGDAADLLLRSLNLMEKEEYPRVYLQAARFYRMADQCTKSLKILEELETLQPHLSESHLEKARCFINLGLWEEGEKELVRYKQSQPDDALPNLFLSHIHYLQGAWSQALEELEKLESSGHLQEPQRYFLFLEKAQVLFRLGRWRDGEKILLELLNYKEVEREARTALLEMYEQLGCPARGWNLVTEMNSSLGATWSLRFSFAMGEVEEARPFMNFLFWMEGDRGYAEVANIAADYGYYALALQILDEGEEVFPGSPALLFSRGNVYAEMGKLDKAQACFSTLIDQGNALAMNYLGYLMLENNINIPQAKDIIKKAHHLDVDNGAILDSLGWAYFKLGDLEKALFWLEKANRTLPHDPEILEHIGDVYRRLGKSQKARTYYRMAIQCQSKHFSRIVKKLQLLP